MSRGILYHFTGMPSVVPLICSLLNLRKFYGGRVAIATIPELLPITKQIASDPSLDCEIVETYMFPRCVHPHWVAKVFTYLASPFERTLYLDADTIVQKPCLHEFFRTEACVLTQANGYGLADINGYGRYGRQQLEFALQHGPVFADLYAASLEANVKLINAGVLAFTRGDPILQRVHDLLIAVRRSHASDEHIFQLLMASMPHELWPQQYNWLPERDANVDNRLIYHFFRKQWRKKFAHEFQPYLDAAMEKNTGGIRSLAVEVSE